MKLSLSRLQVKTGDILVVRDDTDAYKSPMEAVGNQLKQELKKYGKDVIVVMLPAGVSLEVLPDDLKKRILQLYGCKCEVSS